MKKFLLSVIIAILLIGTMVIPAIANDVTVEIGVYSNTLNLENKDASWTIIGGDGIGGILGYNPSGATFDYSLYVTGLSDGDYALIYYADTENRFVDWGGNHPGAIIGFGASSGGVLSISGSTQLGGGLGMDLPCPPDANAYFYDYTASDGYVHDTGAKIWLVPISALTGGTSLPVSAWPQTNDWLFETDLITFDDTDITPTIIGISVSPSSIDLGPVSPSNTAGPRTVTVTSIGNVSTDVTASASAGLFQYLELDAAAVSAYSVNLPYNGDDDDVAVTLPVPSWYALTGQETGTLTFSAVAH